MLFHIYYLFFATSFTLARQRKSYMFFMPTIPPIYLIIQDASYQIAASCLFIQQDIISLLRYFAFIAFSMLSAQLAPCQGFIISTCYAATLHSRVADCRRH